jgi:hypothetical protein
MAKEDDELDQNVNHGVTDDEVKLLEGGSQPEKVDPPEPDEEHEEVDEDPEATARRDSELDSARNDEEREAIRARRRDERKNKQKRQREKIETMARENEMLKQQLAGLAQKVGSIENATLGQSMAALDQEIAKADQAAKHYRSVAAAAIQKQDGAGWQDAQEKAEFASTRLQQLRGLKDNVAQSQTRQQTQPQPLNPEMVRKATAFKEKNPWYGGPQSSEMDSQVLTQLDSALMREGWDPTSDAYWEELEARKNKYLPHRGQATTNASRDANAGDKRPRQPVAGSSSSNAQGTSSTYTVNAERVRAMKEAGLWNDPKKRAAAIERYRKYDQDNGIKS